MTANRASPAPSNTPGVLPGSSTLDDIAKEVAALWRHAAVPLTNVAGTANAITADCLVPLWVREAGNKFSMVVVLANTGPTNLAINGLASRPVINRDGSALANGRLAAGRLELFEDDGTSYRLLLDKPLTTAAPLLSVFAYQTATGTDGSGTNVGWNKVQLNTNVLTEIPGVNLNTGTNVLTLPAGTYEVDAQGYANASSSALHLWDVVAAAAFTTGLARQQGYYTGARRLFGKFTLAATKTFELRMHTSIATGAGGLGYAQNIAGIPEQHCFIALRVYP
jgi:hypothetical protein